MNRIAGENLLLSIGLKTLPLLFIANRSMLIVEIIDLVSFRLDDGQSLICIVYGLGQSKIVHSGHQFFFSQLLVLKYWMWSECGPRSQVWYCTHARPSIFKTTPIKTSLALYQKMTPKQVLAQFQPMTTSPLALNKYYFDKSCIVDMTLITTREEFYTPLFLKHGDFEPLNESRVSLTVCQKNTTFYVFFWSCMTACVRTLSYLNVAIVTTMC